MIPASQDDRVHPSPAMRKRMQERGLSYDVPAGPLTVAMEDEIMHTVDFPVCGDEQCICYQLEYEARAAERAASKPSKRRSRTWNAPTEAEQNRTIAALNGNRAFSILR